MRGHFAFLFVLSGLAAVLRSANAALQWLHVDTATRQIVNEDGATVLMHGVNVVYKIPPWIPNTQTWNPHTSFTDEDIHALHNWGFNIVRLGVMWPGVRPNANTINSTYLALIEEIVKKLGEHGIYTLLDLHQDLLSRYYCGEGAPDFLIKPISHKHDFPWPLYDPYRKEPDTGYPVLEQCLIPSLFAYYYYAENPNDAFELLYTPGSALNRELHLFWDIVAQRFEQNSNVIGYDLLNEPIAGHLFKEPFLFFDPFGSAGRKYLQPLYESLHETIRKHDRRHILFFEPALNNLMFTSGFSAGPGGREFLDRQVYSHHLYCGVVTPGGCPTWPLFCEYLESFMLYLKMAEMHLQGWAGMITEFGALGDQETCVTDLHRVLRKAEESLQGWVYWEYKYNNDLTTSNREQSEGFYDKTGRLQVNKVNALTRPYVRLIAGALQHMAFDVDTHRYTVVYTVSVSVNSYITEIYVNKGYYGGNWPHIQVTPAELQVVVKDVLTADNTAAEYCLVQLIHTPAFPLGTRIEAVLTAM